MSTLPQFFGANPAVVPRDVGGGAPRAGFRLLGNEEDLARQWLASLTPPQRARAIFDTPPYGDIVSRNAPVHGRWMPWAWLSRRWTPPNRRKC